MSVAYDLDVNNLNSVIDFSHALVDLGNGNPPGSVFRQLGVTRFSSPVDFETDIFPTGEYIIRKGMYINGTFFIVGSYKAYCRDLFGVGNNGYAWDGFLLAFRGYNISKEGLIEGPFGPNDEFMFGPHGNGFLPMRMMFEVNPGPIGSATAIANDSEVGLYGIDFYKSEEDFSVLEASNGDINLILCGFQRIDPTVEGVPTGSDYVGNIYMGQFLKYDSQVEMNPDGDRVIEYLCNNDNIMQITWKANVAGHTDRTLEPFGRIRDLNEWLGVTEPCSRSGGAIWNFSTWTLTPETKPDSQKRAVNCNIFPRRFYDITCKSLEPYTTNRLATSPFIIVGDAALDTNDDGAIDKTVPMSLFGCYPFIEFLNADLTWDQAPYLLLNPSGSTSLSIDPNVKWFAEGAANIDGSVAVFCSLPYEATDLTIPFDIEDLPATLIALNGVPNGGDTYGAIFATQDSLLYEAHAIYSIAMEGGSMTTATGVQLPNKWYGKAVQQRTFTIREENYGKQGTLNPETGEFTPNVVDGIPSNTPSIFDADSKEYIGYNGNFQRYGAFTLDSLFADEVPNKKAGDLSGAGYGFLGIRDGVGAIAVMFDSGSPINTFVGGQNLVSMVVRAEGANISANCITNPSSATRNIINCGWDNDRDQWLFIASDTNQVSVISASSDFSTASNNLGFLDQTDNFLGIEANTDAAMYFPISMSNSLDGLGWFGEIYTNTENGLGIKPKNLGSAVSTTVNLTGIGLSVTYDAYPNAKTQVSRITGTSGRTARVWVDYILFDGADAIIANKIKERGMKVSIEAVEWFKRKIIQTGDLNITDEEIEMWMREQQDEYKQTLKENERQGRVRRKKKQVSAFTEGVEEQINPDFMDNEVKEFMGTFTPETRPPTPEEQRIERKKKGGYSPEQGSYYDEVFED